MACANDQVSAPTQGLGEEVSQSPSLASDRVFNCTPSTSQSGAANKTVAPRLELDELTFHLMKRMQRELRALTGQSFSCLEPGLIFNLQARREQQ